MDDGRASVDEGLCLPVSEVELTPDERQRYDEHVNNRCYARHQAVPEHLYALTGLTRGWKRCTRPAGHEGRHVYVTPKHCEGGSLKSICAWPCERPARWEIVE